MPIAGMAQDKITAQAAISNPRDKTLMETAPMATLAATTMATAAIAHMLITTKEILSAEALGINKTRPSNTLIKGTRFDRVFL